MKRQHPEWEKLFVDDATDKGLPSKICKQFIQLNILKKKKSQSKNGQKKDLNRHFSKEDIQMAERHEKMFNTAHG